MRTLLSRAEEPSPSHDANGLWPLCRQAFLADLTYAERGNEVLGNAIAGT